MPGLGAPISATEYGRLLEPFLGEAAGYALSFLKQPADAEDAIQQAALQGLKRLETYDAGQPFKGWWFMILKNCCYDLLREKRARRVNILALPQRQNGAQGENREYEALTQALERLSLEHREILRLKYFGGLRYDEIAQALGIPAGTVMSRLHLARKALSALMNPEDL